MIPYIQAPLLCVPTHSLAPALLQWGSTDTVHCRPAPWKGKTDACLQNLALLEWETALNKHGGYKQLERHWTCFLWESSGIQEQKTQEYGSETIAKTWILQFLCVGVFIFPGTSRLVSPVFKCSSAFCTISQKSLNSPYAFTVPHIWGHRVRKGRKPGEEETWKHI